MPPDQVLTSYNTLIKSLDVPTAEEVHEYRSWVAAHRPIVEAETQFLQHDDDLLALRQRNTRTSTLAAGTDPTKHHSLMRRDLAYGDPAKRLLLSVLVGAVLLPLLVFGVVPSLAARLIIVLIIAGSSLAILAQSQPAWALLEPRCEIATAA